MIGSHFVNLYTILRKKLQDFHMPKANILVVELVPNPGSKSSRSPRPDDAFIFNLVVHTTDEIPTSRLSAMILRRERFFYLYLYRFNHSTAV